MKNDVGALIDHLFIALEQVTEETDQHGKPLDAETTKQRIARAGAVTSIAREIINVHRLTLDAARLISEEPNVQLPRALQTGRTPALPQLRQVQ